VYRGAGNVGHSLVGCAKNRSDAMKLKLHDDFFFYASIAAMAVAIFLILGWMVFSIQTMPRHPNHPPMPYGKRINGCRYILTPDWRGQIVHTEHAANCDNKEHTK
jgi:hypothetical protein